VRPQVADRGNYAWKVKYEKSVLNNQSQTPDKQQSHGLMARRGTAKRVRNDIFKYDGPCATI